MRKANRSDTILLKVEEGTKLTYLQALGKLKGKVDPGILGREASRDYS